MSKKKPTLNKISPVGNLLYMGVTPNVGKLKYDPDNKLDRADSNSYEYTATVRITKAEGLALQKQAIEFFKENTKGLALINLPIKEEFVKNGETTLTTDKFGSEVEVEVTEPTGFYLLRAKSKIAFGENKITIPIMRGNKQRLQNFTKQISSESTGRLYFKMGINDYTETAGVLFFLTGVQFVKFIEGSDNLEAEEIEGYDEDEDDGLGNLDDGLDDSLDDGYTTYNHNKPSEHDEEIPF